MDRSSIALTAEQQFLVENSLEFVHWTIANLIPKSNYRMEYDDLSFRRAASRCAMRRQATMAAHRSRPMPSRSSATI